MAVVLSFGISIFYSTCTTIEALGYNVDIGRSMESISNLLNLDNKTAIVTGGAKGIGSAIAYRLAEAGANVLIADMDETGVQKTAQEINEKGLSALGIKVDVSKESDIDDMLNTAKTKFNSIDILVNNAGIYPSKLIKEMAIEDFEKVISVNLKSVFMTIKKVAEVMKNQGGGKIINVTSIDAIHPSMTGLAHYDASKHGEWGLIKNAALEYADDKIWINAIAPGGIATPGVAAMTQGASNEQMAEQTKIFMDRIPMHRMGDPDEIAKVALFLASNMSSYMTGEQIVVDGGVLLR
jgi:2-dehydro-3-deoxy-D-gluconate 5-dehydrogenase